MFDFINKKKKEEKIDNKNYSIENNELILNGLRYDNSWITGQVKITIHSININNNLINIQTEEYEYTQDINNIKNPKYAINIFGFCDTGDYIESKKDKLFVKYIAEYLIKDEDGCTPKICEYSIVKDSIEIIKRITPLDIFRDEYKGTYKLIDSEEEFNEYMNSEIELNHWCYLKVGNLLEQYGHGLVFHEFIKNINTIKKYNILKSILEEIKDPSVLYLAMVRNFDNKEK